MSESPAATTGPPRAPTWLLGAGLIAVIAAVLGVVAVFGGGSLPERTGPPVEELVVERTVLEPGAIELTLRGAGADPVTVAQIAVNDSFADFRGAEAPIDRLWATTVRIDYPWQDGQPYLVSLLTSTGLVIEHEIPAAVATPPVDGGSIGLMVLLGTYVGVLPVALGMFVLPILRRAGRTAIRVLLAFTVGLLVFLAVDAGLDGIELADTAGSPFGSAAMVLLCAVGTFVVLTGIDAWVRSRRTVDAADPADGFRLALLVAGGIGLHNLGEGLAIGSAFAVGELAVGTALVVGFALHNTTEGLAIVAPLTGRRTGVGRLLLLGSVAGVPAVVGALLGAAVDDPTLSAALLGVGVGAIALVVAQIVPSLRGRGGRVLDPPVAAGVVVGLAVMYLTGLLVVA